MAAPPRAAAAADCCGRPVGGRRRLPAAGDRAAARRPRARLPHARRRRHGGLPGRARRSSCSPAPSPTASGCCATSPSSPRTRRPCERRAIATVCLSGTLEEKLAAAAAAGFDGVELFENDLSPRPCRPPRCARRPPTSAWRSTSTSRSATSRRSPERARAQPAPRRAKFDVMEPLGADTVLVCSNVSPDAVDDDALAAEQLHALAERAAARGIRIAYEALAWGRHVNDLRPRLADRASAPTTRRSASAWTASTSSPAARPGRHRGRSRPRRSSSCSSPTRRGWPWTCCSGAGTTAASPARAASTSPASSRRVLAAGYAGPLSLEVFNDVFRQADPERTAVDAMRSLLVLEERARRAARPAGARAARLRVRRAGGRAGSAGEPSACSARSASPTRPAPHQAGAAVASRATARVLLNAAAPAGRAASPRRGRERRPGALGAARAEALLAPVLPRAAGRARPTSPRSPRPTAPRCSSAAPTTRRRAGCTTSRARRPAGARRRCVDRIDHVALVAAVRLLRRGGRSSTARCSAWSRARASSSPRPTGCPQPGGDQPDGSVRLALNVPLLRRHGAAGRAAARRLRLRRRARRRRAHARARRPAAARSRTTTTTTSTPAPSSSRDLIAALRELGVLYDRDERGEFLHFYTADRRAPVLRGRAARGGYDGYGAANAPVRMAAQRAPVAVEVNG